MHHVARSLVPLAAPFVLTGCIVVADVNDLSWSGDWTEQHRQIGTPDVVEFDAPGTLYITQGEGRSLHLEGPEDALRQIRVHTRDGKLVIAERHDVLDLTGFDSDSGESVYSLEVPDLRVIEHTGRGEINVGAFTVAELRVRADDHAETSFSSLNARSLDLTVAGHANVIIETLDSDRVMVLARDHADMYAHDTSTLDIDVRVQDHAEAWLAGKADSGTFRVADHGDIDAHRLHLSVAEARASDHGSAAVTAGESLYIAEEDHGTVATSGAAEVVAEKAVTHR